MTAFKQASKIINRRTYIGYVAVEDKDGSYRRGVNLATLHCIGLYTILPLPILYEVCAHKSGIEGVGSSYNTQKSCNSIPVWPVQVGGGIKG